MAMPQQLGSATPDVFQLMVATEYHLNRCNIETSGTHVPSSCHAPE